MRETPIYMQELIIYQQKLNQLLMESLRQVWVMIPIVQGNFFGSSSCIPRATGHLGGGSQCACRRHILEEQERLTSQIWPSYSTKGGWNVNLQIPLLSLLPYCCYTMEIFQDTPIHQQSQEIIKNVIHPTEMPRTNQCAVSNIYHRISI